MLNKLHVDANACLMRSLEEKSKAEAAAKRAAKLLLRRPDPLAMIE